MRIYIRLLGYVKPYKAKLAVAFVCMFFYSLFNSLVSVVTYVVTSGFTGKGSVALAIPHFSFFSQSASTATTIAFSAVYVPLMVIAVFFFRGLFDYVSNYLMSNVGHRAVMVIRNDLYKHLSCQSLDFFAKGRTGDLISRIMSDVGQIQGAVTDVIVDFVKQPMVILFNLPLVFYWDWKLAILSLVVFPLVAIPITYFGRKLRYVTRRTQEHTADITSLLQETLAGMHVVKAFNMEAVENERFRKVNRSVFSHLIRTVKITVIQRPLIELLGAFGVAFAVWYGLRYLPLERFVAFIASLFILYEPLKKISKVNNSIQQSIGAGSRIFEIMDMPPSIVDSPGARAFNEPLSTITLNHVWFSYGREHHALEDINFKVEAGQVWAFVGTSGAGKTTLVNLLPRFYDPTRGTILLNDCDVRAFTIHSLREMIGIVTQETVLFNATVRENIGYGKIHASAEEIEEAARTAYAHDFIQALPYGYDTFIGERGITLSGGQRQRLAIARAILKNPPLLILDEATSQLDTESEREVQKAIENLMHGRTVFVIAHRLSTIQHADQIVVLDQGRIVQMGDNESLLRADGQYKKLYALQFNL